jgi:hypothetical protein
MLRILCAVSLSNTCLFISSSHDLRFGLMISATHWISDGIELVFYDFGYTIANFKDPRILPNVEGTLQSLRFPYKK